MHSYTFLPTTPENAILINTMKTPFIQTCQKVFYPLYLIYVLPKTLLIWGDKHEVCSLCKRG